MTEKLAATPRPRGRTRQPCRNLRQRLLTLALTGGLLTAAPGVVAAEPAPSAAPLPLPGWVTTATTTLLWSGSDRAAMAFGPVPVGQPLFAQRGEGDRLFIEDPGNGLGRPGGPAWIDRAAVQPTADPRRWFGPIDPARGVELWSGPDAQAALFGVAGADRLLVWAGNPVGGRLPVLVVGGESGPAWVSISAIAQVQAPPDDSAAAQAASALPPEFPPPAPDPPPSASPAPQAAPQSAAATAKITIPAAPQKPVPALPTVTAADREAFVAEWGDRARRLRSTTGIPPSLVVAIAINETGWGRSRLAREANNFFGLKATRRPGTAGALTVETWEVVDGKDVRLPQPFRAFHSPEESLLDLAQHLRENVRYAEVWKHTANAEAFARTMLAAGYATDPAWVDKLARLRATYNLDRFDR